jgi:hypothetical protein
LDAVRFSGAAVVSGKPLFGIVVVGYCAVLEGALFAVEGEVLVEEASYTGSVYLITVPFLSIV